MLKEEDAEVPAIKLVLQTFLGNLRSTLIKGPEYRNILSIKIKTTARRMRFISNIIYLFIYLQLRSP